MYGYYLLKIKIKIKVQNTKMHVDQILIEFDSARKF